MISPRNTTQIYNFTNKNFARFKRNIYITMISSLNFHLQVKCVCKINIIIAVNINKIFLKEKHLIIKD